MPTLSVLMLPQEYKDRLASWVEAGIKTHDGQNNFSGHTFEVLLKYGLKGFPSTMLGRWRTKNYTRGQTADVLTRIGILKGFIEPPDMNSPDSVQAFKNASREAAHQWLFNGIDKSNENRYLAAVQVPLAQEPNAASAYSFDSGSGSLLQLLKDAQAAPEFWQAVIHLATEKLMSQITPSPQMNEKLKPHQASLLIGGWVATQPIEGYSLESLSDDVGNKISPERLEQIKRGAHMTKSECRILSNLMGMTLDSWLAMGVCDVPEGSKTHGAGRPD